MNPVNAEKAIKDKIVAYLDRNLPVKRAMPSLAHAFEQFQNGQGDGSMDFVRPPYIEVTQSYATSESSLKDLAGQGLLCSEVANAFAKYLGSDDPAAIHLYKHQQASLKAAGAYPGSPKQNLVVCTGTGSGKTECFLLPMIDAIYRQHKAAGDGYKKHIRAMILYPMNALVNDQVDRLRRILKNLPEITFGRYTGETENELDATDLSPSTVNALNEKWSHLDVYVGSDIQDENALPNEYLSRARWRKDGAADILVTNYAMLERLLLLPDNDFFDTCWDFIILDEAHCYTGSNGTEIAWLMRRLERRLRRDAAHGPIQYLATSATLSSSCDHNRQEAATRKFASEIFPATPESFDIEFGEIAKLDKTGANPITGTGLSAFVTAHEALYASTIEFERRQLRLKAADRHVRLMKIIDASGRLPAKSLFDLSWCFDFPNRVRDNPHADIAVDEAIRFLATLVLEQSNERDAWREFLHDESLPGGSAVQNDTDAHGKQHVVGNRLDILDIWKRVAAGDSGTKSIDFVTFYYLYLAAVREVQKSEELNYQITSLLIRLTPEKLADFEKRKTQFAVESEAVLQQLAELNDAWRQILPVKDVNLDYHTLIFRAIVTHPDIESYVRNVSGKPKSFSELAAVMGCRESDLRNIFNLGALAVQKGTRRPLVDVRYHQVVRQICDIGVYFEDGDVNRPHFVRNQEEYAPAGEKIFTFGVCRYCGHPYLLGYADQPLRVQELFNRYVFRSETPEYQYMHAFSWLEPSVAEDRNAEEKSSEKNESWLDLKTGAISLIEQTGASWIKLHAMLLPRRGEMPGEVGLERMSVNSFIPKCAACGNEMRRMAKFGIVTPYEATGEIYKIAVLDAFATLSDPDVDDAKSEMVAAEGRKVLVFSDSRANAARLAYRFEMLKERRLLDRMVIELVNEYVPKLSNAVKAQIVGIDTAITELTKLGLPIPQQLTDRRSILVAQTEDNPTINGLIDCEQEPRGRLYEKLADKKCRYTQLLDFENGDNILVEDLCAVSKFTILRTLRNGSRYNLIGRRKVSVASARIESYKEWQGLGSLLSISDDCVRSVAREIYAYLVRRTKVVFSKTPPEPDFVDELDDYQRKAITKTNFITCTETHAIYKIVASVLNAHGHNALAADKPKISNWLAEFWTLFTDKLSILKPENSQGEYALAFSELCDDLQIRFGADRTPLEEVLPLVIQEHTAQIDGKMGAIYQRLFADGKVNILSCSTTFEMGIDVGGLNNVFLGNLPPASSNYRQRAGRAGRRPGAAAYILSLAGNSVHDQNFYSHVQDLFWGEITPPEIYLDQSIFAARHFRAEALHSFFVYLHGLAQTQGRKSAAAKWKQISSFILGWRFAKGNKSRGEKNAMRKCPNCCDQYFGTWALAEKKRLAAYLEDISGYREHFQTKVGPNYSAVEDLRFQLGTAFMPMPTNVTQLEGYQYYRDLGGCRVPEWDDISKVMKESLSSKRQGLQERLKARMRDYAKAPDVAGTVPNNATVSEDKWETLVPTMPQRKLMMSQTIDILSETCVLPRYGFPTDVIELLPDRDDFYARGVKMQRSLELGLFEYAPGQSVVCNKRRYESRCAAVSAHPGDTTYSDTLAGAMSTKTLYCGTCKKIFSSDDIKKSAESTASCPACHGELKIRSYITPDVFFAKPSTIRYEVDTMRGSQVVHWGGKLICEHKIHGLKLRTGESSDRMLQYVNPGMGGQGFGLDGQRGLFYVHEVQTNIAIWQLQGLPVLQGLGFNEMRIANAYQSALYAVRRSIAKALKVATRDLGCLTKYNYQSISYDFVFFDRAAGGGGCALALVKQSDTDLAAEDRIRGIVMDAIRSLKQCTCQCVDFDHVDLTDAESKLSPVTIPEYKARRKDTQMTGRRPAVSCYSCLKDFDNQAQHAKLDRWDALRVLELQLDGAASEADMYEWVDIAEGEKPLNGVRYKLDDNEVIVYDNVTHQEKVAHIVAKEKED